MDSFLLKLKSSLETIEFNTVIDFIDQHYDFTETNFQNGNLTNEAGENSGSCKLFSFAKLQGFTKEQTLACFGAYYREDVLENPDADNHQNIRNFMEFGWEGLTLTGNALTLKESFV